MLFKALREECLEANLRLPELGLVIFTFGNASVGNQSEKLFAIKPSGIPYSTLTLEDIVIVDFDSNVVDGKRRPSSDTKTHAVLYKHWEFLGGIVHTHSTYATAWAQSQMPIPILGTTHADYLPVDIPCAGVMTDEMITGNYEEQTGYQIIEAFQTQQLDPRQIPMILLANHAPFTWGSTVEKAVHHSAILEELAKMAFLTLTINPSAPRLKNSLIQKHFTRKHGAEAYYGQ